MKTLIIYTSQTGFTKKYAGWIAERVNADILELKEAQKKGTDFYESYDAIVYGGWAMAGTVFKSKWFLDKASGWKDKRLAIFCVGGSPNDNPDVEVMLKKLLTDVQKRYIAAFYCQGGFCYEKMNTASKLAMKMFVGSLKKKKDATEDEKKMAEMISSSYDISDISFTDPIVEYLSH
jgi:menaquinone-dependent protoporphyrinogen IX oxidase